MECGNQEAKKHLKSQFNKGNFEELKIEKYEHYSYYFLRVLFFLNSEAAVHNSLYRSLPRVLIRGSLRNL
jgi:hypothetical protein